MMGISLTIFVIHHRPGGLRQFTPTYRACIPGAGDQPKVSILYNPL